MKWISKKTLTILLGLSLSYQPVYADTEEIAKVIGIGTIIYFATTLLFDFSGIYAYDSTEFHQKNLPGLSPLLPDNPVFHRQSQPSFSFSPLDINPANQSMSVSFKVRF